jgi:uncharacterized protein
MTKHHRRCISCRRVAERSEFWRVVAVAPTRQIQLDTGMGRSAYFCQNNDCLTGAGKKNRLGRALKAAVSPVLFEEIHQHFTIRLPQSKNGL